MEGVRWAFRCGSWSPSRAEWLLAARCVQREERERIGQFVFAKDAKSAMVWDHVYTTLNTIVSTLTYRMTIATLCYLTTKYLLVFVLFFVFIFMKIMRCVCPSVCIMFMSGWETFDP